MKTITISMSDEEFAIVAKFAQLRGITPEEMTLDVLRGSVESDMGCQVNQILDIGMEHEPLTAEVGA